MRRNNRRKDNLAQKILRIFLFAAAFGFAAAAVWAQSDGPINFGRRAIRSMPIGTASGFVVEGLETYYPKSPRYYVADPKDVYCDWTHERDWMYLNLWGRLGYDPETPNAAFEAMARKGERFEHAFPRGSWGHAVAAEVERTMERVLYERFGDLGLGKDRDRDLPVIGAVHNAAGYIVSEMIGCRVEYREAEPPLVIPASRPDLSIDAEEAFTGGAFNRLRRLVDALKLTHGYVVGDVNWGGILNLALDLRGQDIFLDMVDRPAEVRAIFETVFELRRGYAQ